MNSKYKWLMVGIVLVVVLIAGYLLLGNGAGNSLFTNNTVPGKEQTPGLTQTQKAPTTEVKVTSSGFQPQTLTIKAGKRVIWTNNSGGNVAINSDIHPTHLLFPLLNVGQFDSGASVTVTFAKPGKYTYHNELNPDQRGTVIVE